jgi:hypothetical protein
LENSSLVPSAGQCTLDGTLCGRGDYKITSIFWMAAPIEARPDKVKRNGAFALAGWGRAADLRVADFAFDLNHINDVFGSDMVKEWFFRYVECDGGDGKGDRWQGTNL